MPSGWLDVLSECAHVIGLLEHDGHRAVARSKASNSAEWDAYPTSSLPESSIASGRLHRPVEDTVIRHAGGKDSASGDGETTPDEWRDRFDPVRVAVRRMVAEAGDAANRLASAQEASMWARGLDGGEIFGVAESGDDWATIIVKLGRGLSALIDAAQDVPAGPRYLLTDLQRTGLSRLERELGDAKNRLRTAERAMREALPQNLGDVSRVVCKGCGTPKDIVTWFGQKPRQWIASEASCRECVERPRRLAKGRAS